MVQASKSLTSWRLFTPFLVLVGLCSTGLGAIYLYQVQVNSWKEQINYYSERALYETALSWESTVKLAEHSVNMDDSTLRSLLLDVPYIKSLSVYDPHTDVFSTSITRLDLKQKAQNHIMNAMAGLSQSNADLQILPIGDVTSQFVYTLYKLSTDAIVLIKIDLPVFFAENERDTGHVALTLTLRKGSEFPFRNIEHSTLKSIEHAAYSVVEYTSLGGVNWRISKRFSDEYRGGVNLMPVLLTLALGVLFTCLLAWSSIRHHRLSKRMHLETLGKTKELEGFITRFKSMNDNAFDLTAILSPAGTFEYVNSSYYRIMSYSKMDLMGANFMDIIDESSKERVQNAVNQVLDGGLAVDIQFKAVSSKGEWLYLEGGFKPMMDDDQSVAGIVVNCRDISMRKRYADDLTRSQQRFKDFADSSADWLWEVDSDGRFTYVSQGINITLGYTPEEMLNRIYLDALFGQKNDMTRDLIEAKVMRHQAYRDVEFWTESKTGERVCLRLSAVPVFDEKEAFVGYRGAASNITTSKIDRENMFRLATTDHLTGLLNRARFTEELEQTLSLSSRHKTEGALVFIDLDQFKSVNDTHGHDAGDELIKAVADILKENVRTTDVVARLGGDEFSIIMHNITLDEAKTKVQCIISAVDELQIPYGDVTLKCTMSIGLVTYPMDDYDANGLMMRADLAMYRAKDMGRNRMFVEGDAEEGDVGDVESRRHSIREQLKWVDRLRVALDEGDFEIYFQPLVPRMDEANPHFEALLRLKDEDGKIGNPGIFIEAAEHFGLIRKLDMAVITRCIEQQLAMKQKGYEADISINLSGKSLGDPKLLKELQHLVEKYEDLDPRNFTFEMTETAALHDPREMSDMSKIADFIASMQKLGFKFALDDFGTGFSSFNYIKHLNVDCVKIDGSFILPLEHSDKDKLFVKAIVDLTKGMNMKTVAEFVENETILKVLEGLGVDYAQGYHLSKPDPDLEKMCKMFYQKTMKDFI